MTRFNSRINTHFRGYPVVHEVHDPHRNRTVSVFDIGDDECVGLSDGVDAWVTGKSGTLRGVSFVSMLERKGERRESSRNRRAIVLDEAAEFGEREWDALERVRQRPTGRARVRLL